ncbi:DNA-packaging protein [Agrobacterium vitis]|uniref:DNA-packaging protein n=1 Tax=Agrobacterium vitis TaxID=373 RepID=A0A7J4X4F7_AGRVI|nr:DNA-packaging protein [Agrobacterium vitis]KAA3527058.1 DNA-packaging protein [Agrobacterium vitis]MUZ95904.1 DNA-packaging protein [Agrobacterium vitis]
MPAPVGNKFWELRSSHGRKPIFATPDDLWDAACEYFEWVEEHPLMGSELVKFQGAATLAQIPKMRAMTVEGLCLFLDISKMTWGEYKQKEGFSYITSRIDDVMRSQKFSGAAADLLNANIIARDLGLADKSELTGKDGGAIETKDIGTRDLAKAVASLLSKGLNAKS